MHAVGRPRVAACLVGVARTLTRAEVIDGLAALLESLRADLFAVVSLGANDTAKGTPHPGVQLHAPDRQPAAPE